MSKKPSAQDRPYKADYKGATPRHVAEAVLRYRPPKKPLGTRREELARPGRQKSTPA